MFFQACWHKRKTSLGPHPQQENYFVSLVYQISQTLMFHRFVYKVWEIWFFKHADLKEKNIFLVPPTKRKLFCLVVYHGLSNISTLMFQSFVYKDCEIFFFNQLTEKKNINYFVSWFTQTLVHQISQTLMFHRFHPWTVLKMLLKIIDTCLLRTYSKGQAFTRLICWNIFDINISIN